MIIITLVACCLSAAIAGWLAHADGWPTRQVAWVAAFAFVCMFPLIWAGTVGHDALKQFVERVVGSDESFQENVGGGSDASE